MIHYIRSDPIMALMLQSNGGLFKDKCLVYCFLYMFRRQVGRLQRELSPRDLQDFQERLMSDPENSLKSLRDFLLKIASSQSGSLLDDTNGCMVGCVLLLVVEMVLALVASKA